MSKARKSKRQTQATATTITPQKKAAVYVRVSGEYDERTASLDSQEEACRKLVEQNGFTVNPEHIYVERHTGKHLHQRKELTKLRETVERGDVQCVCFYQVDRLSRGGSGHIWILLHEFRTKGITLLSVHDDLSDTPMNNMMLSVKAEFASQELLNIRDRTMRGRRDKLKRGLLAGQGNELYGYRKNKETWKRDIHDAESEIVKRIFKEASGGKTRRSIAKGLDLDNVPTPSQSIGFKRQGVNWQPNTVRSIIRNPAYKGEDKALVWTVDNDGNRVKNNPENFLSLPDVSPAIVDAETWNRANQELDKTSADHTRNMTSFTLLRGLVWCLRCGRKGYVMKRGSTRSIDLFRCSSICRGKACGSSTVSVEWLTHFVWSEIRKIIRNPESLREMIAELSDSESRKGSLIKDREAYEQTIQRIERKKEQLVKSLIRIEPDDADTVALFETEIKSLNQQKRDVEDSLAHVKSCLKDVEENSLDVEGLVELHHKLSFGDEDWDDHKKRDYIEKLDYQIYFDGRSCEIRMRTGKVVSSFTEETALLARDNGSDPQDSDSEGFVSTEFVCKHSSRSPTTSGRRAMCR